jgi:hypothetical protein
MPAGETMGQSRHVDYHIMVPVAVENERQNEFRIIISCGEFRFGKIFPQWGSGVCYCQKLIFKSQRASSPELSLARIQVQVLLAI